MNPIRWVLDFSARMADRRAGPVDPAGHSYERIDSREYEAYIEIAGATLWEGNLKWPERWVQVSENSKRMARVVQTQEGLFRLSTYEREGGRWRAWEGPTICESLEGAMSTGQEQLERQAR